jgi:hypothetical protein
MRYDGGAGELAAAVSQRGSVGEYKQHLENLRRNAQRRAPQYGPLVGLPANNSASNFTGAAYTGIEGQPGPAVAGGSLLPHGSDPCSRVHSPV